MSRHERRGRKPRYAGRWAALFVACNDDNGNHSGRMDTFGLSRRGESLDLERPGDPVRFTERDSFFVIFRRRIQFEGSAYNVGNYCWNRYQIDVPAAAFILCGAVTRRFSITGASGDRAIRLSELVEQGAPASVIEPLLVQFGEAA